MSHVSASQAGRQFSKVLREVAAGKTVIITSKGKPVAKVVSISETEVQHKHDRQAALQRLWERLERQPALNLPRITRDEIYEDVI